MTPFELLADAALGTGADPVRRFLAFMEGLTQERRVIVMFILTDHFCRLCGAPQPPGGCQCQKSEAA